MPISSSEVRCACAAAQGKEGTAKGNKQGSAPIKGINSKAGAQDSQSSGPQPSGNRGKKRQLPEGGEEGDEAEEGAGKGKAAVLKRARAAAAAAARAQDQGSDESDSGSEGDFARKHSRGRKKAKPKGKTTTRDIAKVALGAGTQAGHRKARASSTHKGNIPHTNTVEGSITQAWGQNPWQPLWQ